jgi:hypothetical protein
VFEFAGLEVPVHSRLLLPKLYVIDAYVVVAVDELWSDLNALHEPRDALPTIIITEANFVNHPHVFWEFLCHHLKLGNLAINILLVSCNDIMRVHVLRVHCQYLFGHGDGFGLLDSTEVIGHSDTNIGVDKGWSFLGDLIVSLDGLLESSLIVEDIGIAD